ncbi:MAG: hypothetical protein K0U74_17290 [Alphaproteobacteria bacterium]|nr:hypothetical protein [Alphaproteobacteria bacterium]
MWPGGRRTADKAREDAMDEALGRNSGSSGLLATVISAVALLFSAYTFYESVMRAPELAIYVPPRIDYTDPDRPDSPFEVFIIPVTLANDGARTGTILSIDLKVTNKRNGDTKMFHAAQLGPWGIQPVKPFAPVALSGRESFSQAVQFFPRQGESVARILDLEPGHYNFEMTLQTASAGGVDFLPAAKIKPLVFERQAGQMDYRKFTGTATMAMWTADYKPSGSRATKQQE